MIPKKSDTQFVTPQTAIPRSSLRLRALALQRQIFALASLIMLATSAYAAPITFTVTGTATGFVGDAYSDTPNFTNEPFTISLFADTANVIQIMDIPGDTVFSVNASSSSISIGGIGAG